MTLRVFADGGVAEAYFQGGRIAEIMSPMGGASDDPSSTSAFVQASQPVKLLSARIWTVGSIWVTPEQVLATPPGTTTGAEAVHVAA